jgi:hypothetical protein
MNIREIENLENVQPLEKIKLKMDFKRIKNERFRTWLSAIFIAIPLLLGVGTFFYGIWSENERAKNNFQIKAVEIVLGAESPTAAVNKAIVLSELFPNQLPKNFKDTMLRLYGSASENAQQ